MSSNLLVKYNMTVEKLISYDKNNNTYDSILRESGYDLNYSLRILKITLMRKVLNTTGDEQKFYKEIINELEV